MKSRLSSNLTVFIVLTLVVLGIKYIAPAQAQESVHSDRDILRGLMYGIGPVSEDVGIDIQLTADVSEEQYQSAVDHTVDDLIETHPEAIASALELIRSDDPLSVEQGLNLLSETAIDYANNKAPESALQKSQPAACGAAVVCVVYFVAAAHNTVAVTGLVAVVIGGAVYAGKWTWGPSSAKVSAASREALVMDIIEGV